MLRLLCIGLLLGLAIAPIGWFGVAARTTAQTLPFTPTPTPTDPPTATAPATATPTATATVTPQVVIVIATPTPLPPSPTATATPLPPGFGRDTCDPNHTLSQPCALPTETDVPNMNFNGNATDVYSFLLKGGRQYRISATVDAQGGLDPVIAVFLAGSAEQPIAANDDAAIGNPSAVVTLTVEADAWYLARVINQAPGDPLGKTYTISARSVSPASAGATPTASNPDDLIGNAYDAAHAVRLAWGVPYDLSMICPDARSDACYAGRHTFLLVPVKAAVPFTAITYDLGAGVDTVLTLYAPDPAQTAIGNGLVPGWRAVASNDDIAAGWTLRSQISLVPDWNSLALLVVAPSDREDLPTIPADGRPGRYRLIVGSPELLPVKSVLAGQQDLPPTPAAPTPRPTGQPAAVSISTQTAQDNREVIKESCPLGQALVSNDGTDLYAAAPPSEGDKIASYPPDALVRLLGACYRGWVKVQPADSVTPGWMWGPNLRPEALEAGPTPTAGLAGTPGPAASPTGTPSSPPVGATAATAARLPALVMTPLEPVSLPTAAPLLPAARAVAVAVCQADRTGDTCDAPISDMRVALLLTATRQLLTSGITDANGKVTLSVSVPEGSQILLSIPALGLETALAANATEVPVRVPAGGA